MSSWQVMIKEAALLCLKAAGRTLADEASKKILEQIEENENIKDIQNKIKSGHGLEAMSNVRQLFTNKSITNEKLN